MARGSPLCVFLASPCLARDRVSAQTAPASEMPSLRLVRHEKLIHLQAPSAAGPGWKLINRATQEFCTLLAVDSAVFELDVDDAGRAFVDNNDDPDFAPLWVQDCMNFSVYQDDDKLEDIYFRDRLPGKVISKVGFEAEKLDVEVTLRPGHLGAAARKCRAGVFRLTEGCRIWWSMSDFYKLAGLQIKSYGSVDPLHMRLSNLFSDNDGAPTNVCAYGACSTIVSLGILARLCCLPRLVGGPGVARDRVAVREIVDAMCRELEDVTASRTLSLGQCESWVPPMPYIGLHAPICLHFGRGVVKASA